MTQNPETCLRCGQHVPFEGDPTDPVCPTCGWSKRASARYVEEERRARKAEARRLPIRLGLKTLFLLIPCSLFLWLTASMIITPATLASRGRWARAEVRNAEQQRQRKRTVTRYTLAYDGRIGTLFERTGLRPGDSVWVVYDPYSPTSPTLSTPYASFWDLLTDRHGALPILGFIAISLYLLIACGYTFLRFVQAFRRRVAAT
jgi:hypothetical protein